MASQDRVAKRFLARRRVKVAGEVRFIKDRSGDATEWAWNTPGPSEREISSQFAFNPKKAKPLAECLWSTSVALGHAMNAYTKFAKIKSADVSPDGSLGGKGYIQRIADIRRAYMNVTEALSALSDTLYDEVRAPHWAAISRQTDPETRKDIENLVEDSEEVREDPEGWAGDEMEEEMEEHEAGHGKKARRRRSKTASASIADAVAERFLQRRRSNG